MSALVGLGRASELEVSSRRGDGSFSPAVTIWSVLVDDRLFIRSYMGADGSWFRAASKRGVGRVHGGGQTVDATFVPASGDLADRIDAAYREKYAGSSYLAPMLTDSARDAALEVVAA